MVVIVYASSGGPPAARTGAPGEGNCTGCHASFPVNSGSGTLTIIAPSNYIPGNTYPITIRLQQSAQSRWGFQITALTAANQPAGTLLVTNATNTQKVVSTRQYIHQTSAGTFNGTANGPVEWQLSWQAPATSVGTITFYAAGNAANGDGSTGGDYIYTKSASVPVLLGSISGMKYHDQNANGIKDPLEPALQNWQIKLGGAKIDSAFTDQNGLYLFPNLSDGLYEVSEVIKSTWIQTAPTPPSYSLNISGGTIHTNVDFGNARLGTIAGKKFHDLNQNGIMDGDEQGIADWKIYSLRTLPSEFPDSVFTDINGNYSFVNLINGTYILSEELKNRWIQTHPPDTGTYVVNLELNQFITDLNFGNKSLDTTIRISVRAGWNMLSIPLIVEDYRKTSVFPTSGSSAFMYNVGVGYSTKDTLDNRTGYWLKFGNNQNIDLTGVGISEDTVDVLSGWNLIGTTSYPVAIGSIIKEPPSIITSNYYGYSTGYFITDTLRPGFAYWVKVDQDGKLILKR